MNGSFMTENKIKVFYNTIKVFLLFLLLNQCANQESYIIEKKDGVKIIHNKYPTLKKNPISLKFVRQFGKIETENKNLWLAEPLSIVVDSQNNLYIFDNELHSVKKFDVNGNYLKTFGKMGKGPGEFSYIINFEIDENDKIYIGNTYGRVQIFDTEGNYCNEFKLKNPFSFFKVINSELLLVNKINNSNEYLLHVTDHRGNIIRSFCKMEPCHNQKEVKFLNKISFCKDGLNNFYISFNSQNRIEKISPNGKMLFKADRTLNYNISFQQNGYKTLNTGTKAIKIPKFQYSYVTRDIGTDHKNRLWLITFKKQPDKNSTVDDIPKILKFEVYNQDGILLCEFPVPKISFDSIRIYGDRVFFIDPHKNACVYEYKIMEI